MSTVATTEVIKDVKVLAVHLINRSKDGIGIDDAIALVTDAEVRAAVTSLIANVSKLPAEEKAMTLDDGVALIPVVTEMVIEIIKAAKAPAA